MTEFKSKQEAAFDRIVHKDNETLGNGESIAPDRFISVHPEFASTQRQVTHD